MQAWRSPDNFALHRSLGSADLAWINSVVLSFLLAVIWAALRLAVTRSSWSRPVREVFARQLLFTAVDGLAVAGRCGMAVGIILIVQTELWLSTVGGSTDLVATLFLKVVVREVGPLMACLVVIGRSGTAISTELGNMRVRSELEVLEAQGIDTMSYLVMPRVLSVSVSVFCLTLVVIASIFLSGYAVGFMMDAVQGDPAMFFNVILRESQMEDLLFLLPKTLVAGTFIGAIACTDGLRVRGVATEVPRVAARSGVRQITAVFVISAALSLVIYGRVLVIQVF